MPTGAIRWGRKQAAKSQREERLERRDARASIALAAELASLAGRSQRQQSSRPSFGTDAKRFPYQSWDATNSAAKGSDGIRLERRVNVGLNPLKQTWERKEKTKSQCNHELLRHGEGIESVARDQGGISPAKNLSPSTVRERDRYQSSFRSEIAVVTDAAGPEQRKATRRDGGLDEISQKEAADRIWLEQRGFVTLFSLTQTATGGGTAVAPAGGFGVRNSGASPSRNSYSVNSRFVAQTYSESPRWYTPFSGLSRPRNFRQQKGVEYPLDYTLKESGSYNYSKPGYTDSLYSSTNSIYASFPEFSSPPPNPFLKPIRKHGEPGNTFCTWADSGFTPNFLPASSSYKDSPTGFERSSSFDIGQQARYQGSETQSHIADSQFHSGPYLGQSIAGSQDFQDPIVRQSLANQLEVTSALPGATSFDLERYKDLDSTPLYPPQVPVANRSPQQLEVTSEPQTEVTPESMDESRSSDQSGRSPSNLPCPTLGDAPATMDSTLWLHVQVVHPSPVDLSDSSSQLLQYEQYIKNTIDPQATKYIMGNTALFLPSFSSVSAEPTMTLEVLKPLTPEYCQEYSYFLVRLEGIARDLKALSVDHVYWEVKQRELIGDVKANVVRMRRKMEDRLHEEAALLQKKQTTAVDELMGSPKADKGKFVDKGEGRRSDSNASNASDESHTTSSSIDSSAVRGIEGGI